MSRVFQRIMVLSAAAFLGLPGAVLAQQSQDPGLGQNTPQAGQNTPEGQGQARQRGAWGRGGQRQHMEMLAKKLNLTDTQRQQFREIGQHTRQQVMSIRNDSSLTDDQKKEKVQALRKQSHQEMFGVLTPEQKEQLKQMRQQWQKDHDKNKAPGDQASAKSKDDDDPFAGMTSDDDDGGPVAKAP
jgi:Spy/CpxP family protein refolding chaperone